MCDAQSDDLPPLTHAPPPFAAQPGGSSSRSSMGAACSDNQKSPQPAQTQGVSVDVGAISRDPNVRLAAPQPSPSTHPHRPTPVVVHTKLIKTRTPAGAKTINGRLLMHELGEGATAEVTLCQDPLTGDLFALKKMSKRALSRQKEYGMGPMGRPKMTTGLDKVRREIDLMRQVWHPNVLVLESVIDDPDEDALILVLEFAHQGQVMVFDSKTLKYKNHIFGINGSPKTPAPTSNVAVASPPPTATTPAPSPSPPSASSSSSSAAPAHSAIPESILRKILHDVLNGLEYCQQPHAHLGFYVDSAYRRHLDIKPDNLLCSSDGSIKIADLGVARQFAADEVALISETQGTFHFFSPEMCAGDRFCPFKSDVWSLGVTLFILATGGVVPFMSAEDNPQELFTMIGEHTRGTLPFPADVRISDSLRSLIDAIMDPNPATRLSIQQIREHPWMSDHAASPLLNDMQKMALNEPIVVPDM